MEIKTRKQAMVDGENTYFTGKPCKNGHMNFRYVQSGSCYDCINGDRVSPNSTAAAARNARLAESAEMFKAKMIVKDSLVQIKLAVHDVDLDLVKSAVHAYAIMRHPTLTVLDVCPTLAPTVMSATVAIHKFNCHVEDVPALRALEASLSAARPAQFELERRARLEAALAKAPVEPVPEWANKP